MESARVAFPEAFSIIPLSRVSLIIGELGMVKWGVCNLPVNDSNNWSNQ